MCDYNGFQIQNQAQKQKESQEHLRSMVLLALIIKQQDLQKLLIDKGHKKYYGTHIYKNFFLLQQFVDIIGDRRI
jgi:hypothetical protein